MDTIEWIILTYESTTGEKPVDIFFKKQQPQARAKISHNIRLLRQYGNMLGMPHSKALGRGLYELRVRGESYAYSFVLLDKKIFIYFMRLKNKPNKYLKKI